MKTLIVLLILLFPFTALAADEWKKSEIRWEAAWQFSHGLDWLQTRYIAANPDEYREINPILGKHPSKQKVNIYFAAGAIIHPVISHYLPRKYRDVWQKFTFTASALNVGRNYAIGIRFEF
jgi:hypothetical protein